MKHYLYVSRLVKVPAHPEWGLCKVVAVRMGGHRPGIALVEEVGRTLPERHQIKIAELELVEEYV